MAGNGYVSEAEAVLAIQQGDDFSRERFQEADKTVSMGVRSGTSDARSIEQVIEKVDRDVMKEAAKARFKVPILRNALVLYWTLMGRTAEDIVEDVQGNVNEIARESETNLKMINGSIIRSCKKEATLATKVSSLSHDTGTYEYAMRGYDLQLDEIRALFACYQSGQDPAEVLSLKALSPEYQRMSPAKLERARADIETKKRTAEIELTRLYAILATEGRKLDSTKVATQRMIGQYKKAMGTHVGALNRQTLLIPEGYLSSIKTQAQISKTNERLEQGIKKRDRIAGTLYSGIEDNLETLTGTYEPDFGSNDEIQKSKGAIDERFNEMGQEGEVNFESLRDIAHSYANKYGH